MDVTTTQLTLCLFGTPQVYLDGARLTANLARKDLWLLALLALRNGKPVPRGYLAGTLWPDAAEELALYNLRRSLNGLRDALGHQAACIQPVKPRALAFALDPHCVDVLEFDRLAASNSPDLLARAVSLYSAPLLQDCFEDWALAERMPREFAYQRALDTLASQAIQQKEWSEAERCCRLRIASDPLQEASYRMLMQVLAHSGNHAGVTLVYRDLRLRLREEVHSEPDPETQALHETIRREARQSAVPPSRKTADQPAPSAPGQPSVSGMDGDASARKTPPSYPGRRVPTPLTRLIGRMEEVEEISGQLRSARLVTLLGAGGVGKTRLALEVAHQNPARFADGAVFVELTPLTDPELVTTALAQALDLKEEGGRPLLRTVCAALADKQVLVVLDNCEHLAEGVARLCQDLLGACRGVQVLATSREALRVPGEVVCSISPLAMPPMGPSGGLAGMAKADSSAVLEYASVQLFLERAHQSCPQLRLGPADLEVVARICRRLDGLPLALELAASRVRALSLNQIVSRLDDRFGLLRGGLRTEQAHHQTLRGLLDWSYDLLETEERQALACLSVFAGGWTLEAAESVCCADDVLDHLMSLVDKSLVCAVSSGGEVRYSLLETIREYALDRLVQSGESDAARERHQTFYLALAEDADPQLRGPDQAVWLERLEREHDNLRTALEWNKEGDAALRLGAAMYWFWYFRGYYSEGRERLVSVLAGSDARGSTLARAKALNGAGSLAWSQGDYAAARAAYDESLSIFRELGDTAGIARSLNNLGNVAHNQGDFTAARALHEQALEIWQALGDKTAIANSFNNLGIVIHEQRDYATARTLHEQSLALRHELGDRAGIARSLGELGILAQDQDDHTSARELYEQSLALRQELGDMHGIAIVLGNLGKSAFEQGDFSNARTLYEQSIARFRELGDKRSIATTLVRLGLLACKQGAHSEAHTLYDESITLFYEIGDKRSLANSLEALADLAAEQEQPERAARLTGAVEVLREALGSPLPVSDSTRHDRHMTRPGVPSCADDFASSRSEGRKLTIEQVIEYAHQAADL